ncbi:tetratricopeptide repeat protein [Dermabacteraceae bacterium TAE3-ERU27]|nr:tetratricopeptide repeat protein [Dermabacteraceae bacterium TAE3-ERU27]
MIDLSSLKNTGGSDLPAGAVAVTEANLQDILQGSLKKATLLTVTSTRVPEGKQFVATLAKLVGERADSLSLTVLDADAQGRVAQALRVQQLPTTFLLIKGQPQPLFDGVHAEQQLVQVLDEVVRIAGEEGLETGQPKQLDPREQEAYAALERGDLDAAAAQYEKMLSDNPADEAAKAGRATVNLMRRTRGAQLQEVRETAANAPQSLAAQMAVADLDMAGGHVDDAFARLLGVLRELPSDQREPVRERLLEFFDLVGATDPRVTRARQRLAALLY